MRVTVSAAISLDGYIDDLSQNRLILSSPEDWAEVKTLRAEHDAILVGAETLRRDNPALVTRSEPLIASRLKAGKPADPVKVTVTGSGNLSPDLRFFTEGNGTKIVIASAAADPDRLAALESVATIVQCISEHISVPDILRILSERKIDSLFVEGGTRILTEFIASDVVNHLRVAVAPFFVGQPNAPRFVGAAPYPYNRQNRMTLERVERVGDMAVLHYLVNDLKNERHTHDDSSQPTEIPATVRDTPAENRRKPGRECNEDRDLLSEAVRLAQNCPKSDTAYSVGAVIVTANGSKFTGYSRETAPDNHAEEEAILKALAVHATLEDAVIYSSMEPCSTRKSKTKSCSELIIGNRMKKVVFAAYEPTKFVRCNGHRLLQDHKIEVVVIPELAETALAANDHILHRK